MGRPCAACSSEHAAEINRKLKAKVSNADVSRWLKERDASITPQAIGRHAKEHLTLTPTRGRRPISDDFLTAVVENVHERMRAGELEPTVKEAITAEGVREKRARAAADRDLMLKLAAVLGGVRMFPVIDPEVEAIEAEYRPLLASGE